MPKIEREPTHPAAAEPTRRISAEGREILASAAKIDHDWSLRFSSEDHTIAALDGMSVDDLEAAALFVHYLESAIACQLIRHDMARDAAARR